MVSKNIKTFQQLRLVNGFTQEQVAEQIGISIQSYRYKEKGKNEFLWSEVTKLCDLFNITLNEFAEYRP